MNRRSAAIVVAFTLLVVGGATAFFATVPYVRFLPGPTVNVLGEQTNGKPIVSVQGHKTYKTDGQLRMTTVRSTSAGSHITLWSALRAWVEPDQGVYPYDSIYRDDTTSDQEETAAHLEMVSSQDNAIAAALTELGYHLDPVPAVLETIPGGAAEGKLHAHDLIVKINGERITTENGVVKAITKLKPGDHAKVDILRDRKAMSFDLVTQAATDDPRRAVIGIYPGLSYRFPFDVHVNIPDEIGGPSAGLMFSLAIYDTLTPGSLTGGASIAGTGTIDEAGGVGPIGGIQQKIAGAEADGAKLFLVPPDNCDVAVLAKTHLELVRADTMQSALESIKKYVANPDAKLPACPKVSS